MTEFTTGHDLAKHFHVLLGAGDGFLDELDAAGTDPLNGITRNLPRVIEP